VQADAVPPAETVQEHYYPNCSKQKSTRNEQKGGDSIAVLIVSNCV